MLHILATGTEGNSYHQSGLFLADWLNGSMEHNVIVPIITGGSIDNIERLKEGSADLIVVQRDTLTEAFYHSSEPLGDIEVVMPLFPEALQIFVRGKTGIISITQLKEMFSSGEIRSLGIGPTNSTTYITTKKLLGILDVRVPESVFDTRDPDIYLQDFVKGNVDAVAFFAADPIKLIKSTQQAEIALLSLNQKEIEITTSRLKKLDAVRFDAEFYPFVEPDSPPVILPGTWAFLVARKGFTDNIRFQENISVQENIINNAANATEQPIHSAYFKSGVLEARKTESGWNISCRAETSQFLRGLPPSDELKKLFKIGGYRLYYLIIGICALSLIVIHFVSRCNNRVYFFWMRRYQHIIYGFIFFFCVSFLMPIVIFAAEASFCEANSLTSPILNLSIWERYTWLFILALSGYESDLFPISKLAKILASSSIYISYSIIAFGAVYALIKEYIRRNRRLGMIKYDNWKDHFVICGWHDNAAHLVTSMLEASKVLYKRKKERPKIIILSPDIQKKLETNPEIEFARENKTLGYVNGVARDQQSLLNCNISMARTVLLIADDNTSDADNRTLVRALSISRHCRRLNNKSNHADPASASPYKEKGVYIIAELNDPSWKDSLYQNGINEVICAKEMGDNVILQSAFNHGVSRILERLLTYDEASSSEMPKLETNEFYIVDLSNPDYKQYVNMKFDALSPILREKDVLLIGIKATFYDDSGQEIINEETINEMIRRRNSSSKGISLSQQIIINPVGEDRHYKTNETDQLLVIALDRNKIERLKEV